MKACLLLLAALAACANAQQIRSYTKKELFAGQICSDDGPGWEKLMIGECPQGYNGLRNWAKSQGILGPKNQPIAGYKSMRQSGFTTQSSWPYCNPCNDGNRCFEFKPGVGKCIKDAAAGKPFIAEGETCLDFSGNNKKWKPEGVNPQLYARSCNWPQFSCNWDAQANNGRYTCQRVRDAAGKPTTECYRAAGGRWWGGTDQWYALNKEKGIFVPCGGPNPDYKACTNFPSCAKAAVNGAWPYAGE